MERQKWQLEEAVESLNEQCAVVKNLRDSNRDLTLVHKQLLRDYDVLKSDDADKSKKLLELLTQLLSRRCSTEPEGIDISSKIVFLLIYTYCIFVSY